MAHGLVEPEELARRAKRLYEERIRPAVEEEHRGEFIVIDPDSGDYEVDPVHARAAQRVRARRPQAQLFGLRIGYPTAYRLGGCS